MLVIGVVYLSMVKLQSIILVAKLRKKVEDTPADPRHILTVHGTGYRFEE